MTGKFSLSLITNTKVSKTMKTKNKSLYIYIKLKTGLGDKGETRNVNCHTAYHYHLWSNKDPPIHTLLFL